jgi:hypothetical protein
MRDTSQVGEICRTQLIAALTLQGKTILVPLGEHQRYDLVIEEEDGRFLRVQCKNGRLLKGAIVFYSCSSDSRSVPGHCVRKNYAGQVELFGVYCPDNGKCYLIPVAEALGSCCSLRVDPPRNGQKTRIRWAKDYELRRTPDPETKQRLELEELQTLF